MLESASFPLRVLPQWKWDVGKSSNRYIAVTWQGKVAVGVSTVYFQIILVKLKSPFCITAAVLQKMQLSDVENKTHNHTIVLEHNKTEILITQWPINTEIPELCLKILDQSLVFHHFMAGASRSLNSQNFSRNQKTCNSSQSLPKGLPDASHNVLLFSILCLLETVLKTWHVRAALSQLTWHKCPRPKGLQDYYLSERPQLWQTVL